MDPVSSTPPASLMSPENTGDPAPDPVVTPSPDPVVTPAPSTGIPGQSSARMKGILGSILRQGINMGIRAALRSAGGSFGF